MLKMALDTVEAAQHEFGDAVSVDLFAISQAMGDTHQYALQDVWAASADTPVMVCSTG